MKRSLFTAQVLRNETLSQSCNLIVLKRPGGFPQTKPGHFISVRITDTTVPLLRRPYSIMDLTDSELFLLVKVVGRGSAILSQARPGDQLDIAGPFGKTSFEPPESGKAVFVAGGTGLAPMIFAARMWVRNGSIGEVYLVHGAATKEELLSVLYGNDFTKVFHATIDGSAGFRGDVVSLLKQLVEDGAVPRGNLYSCGPRGMIEALFINFKESFKQHHTSLESVMACGVGACRGCTIPVNCGGETILKTVCSDGTVFRADDIAWGVWQ